MRVYQFRHVSITSGFQPESLASGNGIEIRCERNYKQFARPRPVTTRQL